MEQRLHRSLSSHVSIRLGKNGIARVVQFFLEANHQMAYATYRAYRGYTSHECPNNAL